MKKNLNFIPGGIYTFNNMIYVVIAQTEEKVFIHRTDKYLKQELNNQEKIIEEINLFIEKFIVFDWGYEYEFKDFYDFTDKSCINEPTGFLGCVPDETLDMLENLVHTDYENVLHEDFELWDLLIQ